MTYRNQDSDALICIMCGKRTYSGMSHNCVVGAPPQSNIAPVPYGCICPPGANLTCQASLCPRRGINTQAIS